MVYLPTRFFLSAIYLSTRISFLVATGGKCCEGDSTCSGCWMCPGSELRGCWDAATEIADSCERHEKLSKQVECMCTGYAKIAYCWKQGTCCTEYSPTLSAAANLCNLKTYPDEVLTQDLVDKAKGDAYHVRNTIWHNNSGRNVPKLSIYIKAYSNENSQSTSYHSSSSKNHHQDKSTTDYSSHTHSKSQSYYVNLGSEKNQPEQESAASQEKKQQYTSESQKTPPEQESAASQEKKQQQYTSSSPKLTSTTPEKTHQQNYSRVQPANQYHSTSQDSLSHKIKVHHQAKCSREKHKCQSQIASQYHKARRDTTSHHHVKRAQSPLAPRFFPHPNKAELWKRSERINSKGEKECGVDFLGVEYPSQVPESVAQVFAAL